MGASAPIGIVGGGQLAWMLAEAAQRRGIPLHVQTPGPQDPAVALAASVVQAPVADAAATAELAQRCSAISFENEWVDLEALAPLAARGVQFVPSLEALRPLVCKRSQRELLQRLHLPAPRWFGLEQALAPTETGGSAEAADAAGTPGYGAQPAAAAPTPAERATRPHLPEGFQYPLMAKAASGGYDGRGTALLQNDADLEALLERVQPATWIVEEFVRFERELAVVAARDAAGEVVLFPVVETHQHAQVCDWVLAPAEASHALEQAVRNIAASLLTSLQYVGVLAIEFFYGPRGLQVNELAPRTHNSGHYSIEACSSSQFDQQLRLVSGEPALEVGLRVPGALMVNLLGFESRDPEDPEAAYGARRQALAELPDAHLHWYGKTGSSIGRKLGHLTLLLHDPDPAVRRQQAMQRLEALRQIWPLPPQVDR
jgi:5-(carboxyamino)imidazole ribonucleotide synthase